MDDRRCRRSRGGRRAPGRRRRREAAIERRDRVFGAYLAAAAMREHKRTGRANGRMHRAILAGIESGMPSISTIKTLGDLRRARAASPDAFPRRSVKNEVRDNLIAKLRSGEPLFPGIIGYDETVIPQLVNAVLSRHNFILLGLRGQAKSRILRRWSRCSTSICPSIAGCEIHDDPFAPICSACRMRIAAEGDETNRRVAPARGALRRKTRDARRDDRRHARRHRSDQGGAQRAAAVRRAHDPLRAAAARQPRHLRHQRAARPRREDSGRPVQHPAGRRHPD